MNDYEKYEYIVRNGLTGKSKELLSTLHGKSLQDDIKQLVKLCKNIPTETKRIIKKIQNHKTSSLGRDLSLKEIYFILIDPDVEFDNVKRPKITTIEKILVSNIIQVAKERKKRYDIVDAIGFLLKFLSKSNEKHYRWINIAFRDHGLHDLNHGSMFMDDFLNTTKIYKIPYKDRLNLLRLLGKYFHDVLILKIDKKPDFWITAFMKRVEKNIYLGIIPKD